MLHHLSAPEVYFVAMISKLQDSLLQSLLLQTFDARLACAYQTILVGNLAEDAAHDLARARLGHARRPVDGVWGGDGSNGLAHCRHKLLPHALIRRVAVARTLCTTSLINATDTHRQTGSQTASQPASQPDRQAGKFGSLPNDASGQYTVQAMLMRKKAELLLDASMHASPWTGQGAATKSML